MTCSGNCEQYSWGGCHSGYWLLAAVWGGWGGVCQADRQLVYPELRGIIYYNNRLSVDSEQIAVSNVHGLRLTFFLHNRHFVITTIVNVVITTINNVTVTSTLTSIPFYNQHGQYDYNK